MRKIFLPGFLCILLAACSNDQQQAAQTPASDNSQQSAAPKNINTCSLITEADARPILGEKVKPGTQNESMCQYISGSEELMKSGESVSLTLHRNAGSEFEKYVADTESSLSIKTEPVSGVGDRASWAEGSLIVKKGNDLLIVIVGIRTEKEKHIEMAKELANKIISRMG